MSWLYILFGQRRLTSPEGSGLQCFSASSQPTHVPCSCAETPPLESGYLRSSVSLRLAHPPSVVAGEQEALGLGKEPEPQEAQEQMLKWDGGTHNMTCSHPLSIQQTLPYVKTFSRPVRAENKCHNTWRKLTQPTVTCKLQTLDLLYWETVQEKATSHKSFLQILQKRKHSRFGMQSGASTSI